MKGVENVKDMKNIERRLKEFKLSGIAKTLEARNRYAIDNNLTYIDFLKLLLEDEYINRQSNSFRKRLTKSKLDTTKTLDSYDFTYQPKLNKKELLDIASCRFIEEKKNIIFMGNPGVGKTHLANAIGLEALKQGYKVLFIHTNDLILKLISARGDGTYTSILNQILSSDLLIIDEVGFKKIPSNYVDEFFEVIRRRYEKGSIIITTNRPFEEWANIFSDAVLASAIVDRLVHHCHIFKITGESYRIKHLKEAKDNQNSLN
ncbi:IS21-like element helper ATPase IstB [Hippea maritima]|uniref:IstB domain protein ATP-binding protein n=1 Tax=Hippea maritima (strain ATCC 700847 / DSM 10411 / MH2) TaxID=760142 RepID=F2LTX1_HIPMA|nr:IS21-like element helper ATPase IstB [Hippea maritima]AEA33370.1 IstB domain protein ATP-binding protein [Hippea maritima DSM 10411]AEA33932.1 IstB domain protein ATP-binding protein [Hippea maritima DSM 10411]AEA34545.1 IstB domain protein ATP-binding protein [Hippea maritima DSM 10411]AEA34606.1 IstB domain protein ATP-binding protein [Hippea maritima DSM 10411]AEA34631.1 IstB domain protein ATP-binding protein [Hippea maritima DSM 10411]